MLQNQLDILNNYKISNYDDDTVLEDLADILSDIKIDDKKVQDKKERRILRIKKCIEKIDLLIKNKMEENKNEKTPLCNILTEDNVKINEFCEESILFFI